ncbi:MAG TPA: MTH938/NDUFAF3 family protein [Steroidobacteraceae bacterium]|nr:MTH938/NDUFAF3 family protein [Steroidobacteraceae bacterium]
MKLTLDARRDVNVIRAYALDEVRIGERNVRIPCVVSGDSVITEWDVARSSELDANGLEPIFALHPEVVLLGTGSAQQFPSGAVRAAFAARGIGLEVMDLGAACRTYNILVQEQRRVIALLLAS